MTSPTPDATPFAQATVAGDLRDGTTLSGRAGASEFALGGSEEYGRTTSGANPFNRRDKAMNRAEFEATLRQEGYEVKEDEIEPHRHYEAHAHDFDARVLVLDGSITLVFGTDRVTYRPGDSFSLPAGTMHEEHTEADGTRLVEGYREPKLASAAK